MLLVEEGKLAVDQAVCTVLPEFQGEKKRDVTIRQLLTHTSGLSLSLNHETQWVGYEAAIERACAQELTAPPGTQFTYCDVNFILLGEIVERISGERLDRFCQRRLFQPMQMTNTCFTPSSNLVDRIAPTEKVGDQVFRGVVHDPTCRRMGGVAGHAGLFSTDSDIAKFAHVILANGKFGSRQILKPETIAAMVAVQTPASIHQRRGFGWDIDSEYSSPRGTLFPITSFGHTGWTGCSLWIDRASQSFVVLMTNRNHPNEHGSVVQLRKTIGTLAAEAVGIGEETAGD
jgi:CubicO group peptidase (beta-lactamase class C family)